MKVKKLSGKVQDAQQIPTLFDNENITYHPIDIVNWKEYPYQPQVSFRIAYTNDAILVHYKVVEDSVRAKQRKNTSELQKMLIDAAHLPTVTQNDIIVTNVRHYEALNKALEAIHRVQNGLDSQISGDFLSQDIRECIFFISDIAGEVTNDMVLQNIFQHFCIGK